MDNPAMNAPQSTSPRRRLQELLAIPDSQRTDEEWDELNELEISLAPGNREGAPDPNLRRPTPSTGIGGKPPRPQRQPGQHKPGQGGQKQGGQKQGGPKQGGVKPISAQPQSQSGPEVKAGEDGQPRKPARKFRKRGPKPKADGAAAAPAAPASGGGSGSESQ